MAENETENVQHKFWDFKKYKEHEWFRFLTLLLLLIVAAYIFSHYLVSKTDRRAGYEYAKLDKEQLQQLNRIYFGNEEPTLQEQGSPTSDTNEVVDTNKDGQNPSADAQNHLQVDTTKCYRAVDYIQTVFNNKVDSGQLGQILQYLRPAKHLEAIGFLANIRLLVKSYFWLTGPEVYFEIIFWSWFGVIASLLFNLGVVARNRTTDLTNDHSQFDSSEIPYQFAKLWYAPLATLAIVLGYNYFNDQNIVDISSSKGVIVFAFIGGFYSARLIALLDRLKEVLLPNNSTSDLPVQKPADAEMLSNTKITLELDDTITPEDTRNDIAEIGLGSALVTLQDDVNGETITAERDGEDQSSSYIVRSIKPGKYSITATWSKEVNGAPVNLKAVQSEEIKSSDQNIAITMKKAEEEG
ncbi:MAG: hypothetical protein INR73_17625 [Williamsia sp.]|nr:hypothetical protein [Williamsia sp.]